MKADPETKKIVKRELIRYAFASVWVILLCGLAYGAYAFVINPQYDYSGSSGIYDERYEITTNKEEFATYNIVITWDDGVEEDYGTFKMFLGSPMKVSYGGDWEDAVTVNYYSPMDTIKSEGNVKLVVRPKRARVRGDPTFYRGIDFRNDTRLEQVHVVTDAVFFDEETNELTYNFEIEITGNGIPMNMSVSSIEARGDRIVKADMP